MDIQGIVHLTGISDDDLRAGLYDYAQVECFQVNWQTLGDIVPMVTGWFGEVTLVDGQFKAELRGLTQKLQKSIGEQYTPQCQAELGDTRCGYALVPIAFTVTVGGDDRIFTAAGLTQADDFFKGGKVTFSSGDNDGFSMDVKSFSAGVVELYEPLPTDIALGDTGEITQGCDKTLSTCKTVFDNVINFRGCPHLPGTSELLRPSKITTQVQPDRWWAL
jgi:uncharacterized phage protein (TIGR02218 family)